MQTIKTEITNYAFPEK